MKEIIAPLIQVNLVWATHHAWKPCQSLQFAAPAPALWLVTEGEIELGDGHHCWQIGAGQAFLWSAALRRSIVTRTGARWLSLGMHVNFFDDLELSYALDLPAQWTPAPAEWSALFDCTRELVRHWHGGEEMSVDAQSLAFYTQKMEALRPQRAPVDQLIVQSLARAIFGMCWKRLARAEADLLMDNRVPPWVAETLRRIHHEPGVSVAQLAHGAGFSAAQFRRSFSQHVGLAPRSYLINHRLELARQLLEREDLPVGDIARRCGFSSASHFIHLFKRSSGLAPLQYRQAARSSLV